MPHTDHTAAANTDSPHPLDAALSAQVREAVAAGTPLRIVGGDTKAFYGRTVETTCTPLSLAEYRGIVHYAPTELVITARAGTPLAEIEAALTAEGQMLAFEPPYFDASSDNAATLGGTVACALSGPRRPYTGAVRDFVLGVRLLNGKGDILRFGGEVMKNVAGYDVSRLTVGALGTLGVLLDISLKVLPRPASELTLVLEEPDVPTAIARMNHWAGQPLPLSASAYEDGRLYLRLSGTAGGVAAARAKLGGEQLEDDVAFWLGLREHTLPFFAPSTPLWRLSLPPAAPPLALDGDCLLDWGGAQRWLRSTAKPEAIRAVTAAAGGHASLFYGGDRHGEVFHPLSAPMAQLHRRLKQALDPAGVFNPGRMYADI